MTVTQIGPGMYRVIHEGRSDIVFVAGPREDRWAFSSGETYRIRVEPQKSRQTGRADTAQPLTAPMPATVLKVLVQPGDAVRRGDAVLILEAMKMELPVRSPADATVTAIHCREGDLVQPDVVLVELK